MLRVPPELPDTNGTRQRCNILHQRETGAFLGEVGGRNIQIYMWRGENTGLLYDMMKGQNEFME